MSENHWLDYHTRWARLRPPLRPDADVVAAVARAFSAHRGDTLLLGVTPELADVAPDVTAVDRSESMIASVWPGDTPRRRAVKADWLALPFEPARFDAAVGDGSLNAVESPHGHATLLGEVARVLRPGGRAVIRVFRRPDPCECVADVIADALGARIATFHGFKWRLAMALAAERLRANLPVIDILAAFERAVPDRDVLAHRAGFAAADIETIDVYRGSREVYSFPSEEELLRVVPPGLVGAELVGAGAYELAERCPLLVLDRAI
jgi:SAM-dependent methyltransferase